MSWANDALGQPDQVSIEPTPVCVSRLVADAVEEGRDEDREDQGTGKGECECHTRQTRIETFGSILGRVLHGTFS